MGSNRWLIVVATIVVAVVGASVAVAALGSEEEEFAADTPEGVVQRYLRAVENEDANAILAMLAPEAAARCNLTEVRNALRFNDRDLRVTLRGSEVTGDSAEVTVHVTERTGGPFDGGSFDHEETFDLLRVSGEWKIATTAWPVYCPDIPRGLTPVVPAPVIPTATSTPAPTPASTATATPTATPGTR